MTGRNLKMITIETAKDADMVLLDYNRLVYTTIVASNIVFQK